MSDGSVAIIVLNWKGWEDTLACVESLAGLDYNPIGVFVCDNASPNDSIARIKAWSSERLDAVNAGRVAAGKPAWAWRDLSDTPRLGPNGQVPTDGGPNVVTLIQTGANLGYAGGNNVGMRYAMAEGYDYCWVLNNDTEVDAKALSAMVERMREDDRIGMCGSTLVYHGKRDMVQNLGGGSFSDIKGRAAAIGFGVNPADPIDRAAVEAELRFVSGASMLVSRAFLENVGEMGESYFLYGEEMDWSFRARGQYTLGYAPGSIVYHKVGASIGTDDFGDRSPLSDYYLARSRVKLCWKHSKMSLPFVLLDTARDAGRWMVRGKPDRAALLFRAASGLPMPKSGGSPGQPGKSEDDIAAVYDLVTSVRLVTSKDEESALVEELVRPRQTTTLAFLNQHGVNLARKNAAFRTHLAESSVLVRDGVGLELALGLLGRPSGLNINGTDFIPRVLKAAAAQNLSVVVLGTDEPWLAGAVARIRELGVRVTASMDGFRDTDDYLALVAQTDPDVVLLGMGMPRQEEVTDLLAKASNRPRLIINGGAILDFYADRFQRAPEWVQSVRLEWVWRLLNEPKRLAPRYIGGGFAFLGTLGRLLLLRLRGERASEGSGSKP